MDHRVTVEKKNTGSLVLNPFQNLSLFFNQFNNLSDEKGLHHDDVEKNN